jgi:hypothetical protein
MKTARRNLFVTVLTVSLALLSLAPAYSVAGDKKPVISKKELKVLLKTATEPADHQKIAQYYRHEALLLTNSSKEHQELAAIYEKNPPNYPGKGGAGYEFGKHCQHFAELQAEAAKEAEALATLHEDMAKEAAQKQQ